MSFSGLTTTGDIVLDFVGDGVPSFNFTNATVNRVWLTRQYTDQISLTLNNSQVTFYFPDAAKKETVFYGYTGTQNGDFLNTRVLYQMQYRVK